MEQTNRKWKLEKLFKITEHISPSYNNKSQKVEYVITENLEGTKPIKIATVRLDAARLIVAAPQMLKELKHLKKWFDTYSGPGKSNSKPNTEYLEYIISNAEGK